MIYPHGWVTEFREAAGKTCAPEERAKCWKLLRSRLPIVKHVIENDNRAGVARELADLVYACYDVALTFDIHLDDAVKETHRSTMSARHADGEFHLEEDSGRVILPDRYHPPLMTAALRPRPKGSVVVNP